MDQMIKDVRAMATAEVRETGSIGHLRAREYMTSGGWNSEVFCPVSDCQLSPILVGAHYDTFGPMPGADDNAAAVAVLLKTANIFRSADLERDVILAYFDAKEPPHFFSSQWARSGEDQRAEEIHCAIVVDLVGHYPG